MPLPKEGMSLFPENSYIETLFPDVKWKDGVFGGYLECDLEFMKRLNVFVNETPENPLRPLPVKVIKSVW